MFKIIGIPSLCVTAYRSMNEWVLSITDTQIASFELQYLNLQYRDPVKAILETLNQLLKDPVVSASDDDKDSIDSIKAFLCVLSKAPPGASPYYTFSTARLFKAELLKLLSQDVDPSAKVSSGFGLVDGAVAYIDSQIDELSSANPFDPAESYFSKANDYLLTDKYRESQKARIEGHCVAGV